MDAIATLFIAVSVIIVAYVLSRLVNVSTKYGNMPPCPPTWPMIGNLPLIIFGGQRLDELSKNVCEKYGGMATLWLGPLPLVFVSSVEICKEALVNNAALFSDRISTKMIKEVSCSFKGIISAHYGKNLTVKRKWTHQALKALLVDNEPGKDVIKQECKGLVNRLSSTSGEAINIKNELFKTLIRITSTACFGPEFAKSDENIQKVRNMLTLAFEGSSFPVFLTHTLFPVLSHAPMFKLNYFRNYMAIMDHLVHTETVKKEKVDIQTNDILGHFSQALSTLDPEEAKLSFVNDPEERHRIVSDIFVAGSEAVSKSLLWSILMLAKWPEVQHAARDEVERVFETDKGLNAAAISDFPYVRAFMSEVLRFASLTPFPLAHLTAREAHLRGYTIPSGTMFIPHFAAMHHDCQFWTDPKDFKPERFLREDGSFYIPNKSFVPFSAGPRVCLGELIAKKEVVFILAYLLLAFNILPSKEGLPGLEDEGLELVLSPKPFQVVLQSRCVEID